MAIERLQNYSPVSDSTLFAINQNGLDYNATGLEVANYIAENATVGDGKVIQYAAPTTGSTVAISGTTNSVWLVLTPAATIATLTITLPLASTCVGGQELLVNSTQTITTLTIGANGGAVVGAPATLAANGFFRLRFEPVLKTWYRVG